MSSAPSTRRPPQDDDSRDGEFGQLRQLLLGPEQVALEELRHRLDDRQARAEETSQIVAEAIALRARRDRAFQQTLNPLVEEAVRISVARNPAVLADVLFPIIGEAVRKAVAHALRGMMETLNQLLERSVSWQGIGWRIEALRTGKSFGEIALTRSLRYRVEQVFLIHRQTSLLLAQVVREQQVVRDADLVSGMLTAVQDFVHDSLTSSGGEELQTIEQGDYSVWVQHGPSAHLAAVVTGTPPGELRTVLQKALERIHLEFGPVLAAYEGDTSTVEGVRPYLQACLLGQQAAGQVRRSRLWMWPVGAIVLLIFLFAGRFARERMRWNAFVARLRSEPGIVLTAADANWGHYRLSGLRDPLSVDPDKLLADLSIDPTKVAVRWEPYVSLDPKFAASRNANTQKDEVERQVLRFALNSARLESDQAGKLDLLEVALQRLNRYAAATGQTLTVEVEGHTDPTGAEDRNAQLSQERAESAVRSLTGRGLHQEIFRPVGVGSNKPMTTGGEYLTELDRRVTFRVLITKKQP